MDDVTIRKGTRADLPAIHKLVGELAAFEKEPDSFTASIEDYFDDFANNIFEIIVAEAKDKIVGMALYYMAYSTWRGKMLYLEDFVVNDAYRSMGVGQKIFDAFMERAHDLDCKMVKWQVLDWNEGAIKFYKRNGAEIETNWYNGKIIF
jgi:GNAT superfamily N-acetyltransferase